MAVKTTQWLALTMLLSLAVAASAAMQEGAPAKPVEATVAGKKHKDNYHKDDYHKDNYNKGGEYYNRGGDYPKGGEYYPKGGEYHPKGGDYNPDGGYYPNGEYDNYPNGEYPDGEYPNYGENPHDYSGYGENYGYGNGGYRGRPARVCPPGRVPRWIRAELPQSLATGIVTAPNTIGQSNVNCGGDLQVGGDCVIQCKGTDAADTTYTENWSSLAGVAGISNAAVALVSSGWTKVPSAAPVTGAGTWVGPLPSVPAGTSCSMRYTYHGPAADPLDCRVIAVANCCRAA